MGLFERNEVLLHGDSALTFDLALFRTYCSVSSLTCTF